MIGFSILSNNDVLIVVFDLRIILQQNVANSKNDIVDMKIHNKYLYYYSRDDEYITFFNTHKVPKKKTTINMILLNSHSN